MAIRCSKTMTVKSVEWFIFDDFSLSVTGNKDNINDCDVLNVQSIEQFWPYSLLKWWYSCTGNNLNSPKVVGNSVKQRGNISAMRKPVSSNVAIRSAIDTFLFHPHRMVNILISILKYVCEFYFRKLASSNGLHLH